MQKYLTKQSLHSTLINESPTTDLGLIITIPCRDEPHVAATFNSLKNCTLPACAVEVILLINDAENDTAIIKSQNKNTLDFAQDFAKKHNSPRLKFFAIHISDIPKKQSGVGTARKIAMDEAIRRFILVENSTGVITGLDADSLVQENYFTTVFDYFKKDEKCQAASIHYEHPLAGDDFPTENYAAILTYELHLRYYVHAKRAAGLPTAFQTVGSSMAVRANAYAAQGGMPRKKAGEDFYFIHKFTGLGGFREIRNTTVIPSPRISTRVPFGTGKAIGDILKGNPYLTHAPASFDDLHLFFLKVEDLYEKEFAEINENLPATIKAFLEVENFSVKLQEIKNNTNSKPAFIKRFFAWFDAFRAMKYVHYVRDNFYADMPVKEAVREWLVLQNIKTKEEAKAMTEREMLEYFRKEDGQQVPDA